MEQVSGLDRVQSMGHVKLLRDRTIEVRAGATGNAERGSGLANPSTQNVPTKLLKKAKKR